MFKNGSVIVSKAYNIFTNLAFEEWLYNNLKCTANNLSFLLIWRNKPAVVIGKHQNPWIECNTSKVRKNGVDLARRSSGGGTVYHDMGNINLSFFTPRQNYNREANLLVICKALQRWNLNILPSKRHDLLWENFKVSGTASKLGRENAYHHCTLLLDVDEYCLKNSLHQDVKMLEITSKATKSVRASVQNLKRVCPNLDGADVILEIAKNFRKNCEGSETLFIDPTEDYFQGITSIEKNLRSWEWIFGKTPRFIITKRFLMNSKQDELLIQVTIYHGYIEALKIEPYVDLAHDLLLINTKFTLYDVNLTLDAFIRSSKSENEKNQKTLIKMCLLEILSEF